MYSVVFVVMTSQYQINSNNFTVYKFQLTLNKEYECSFKRFSPHCGIEPKTCLIHSIAMIDISILVYLIFLLLVCFDINIKTNCSVISQA